MRGAAGGSVQPARENKSCVGPRAVLFQTARAEKAVRGSTSPPRRPPSSPFLLYSSPKRCRCESRPGFLVAQPRLLVLPEGWLCRGGGSRLMCIFWLREPEGGLLDRARVPLQLLPSCAGLGTDSSIPTAFRK